MARGDIPKLLDDAKKAVESDYTEKVKSIKAELDQFKKKTLGKI